VTGEPLPEYYKTLTEKFWPGPLTILLPVPKDSRFAKNVHPGQSTIGFRIPSSKYARFFIAATDRPIAGPSANSSGKPSPTTAQHVLDDLKGKINFILDGGACTVGVESTVVDGMHDPPLILRPGGVSQSDLIAHGKEVGNKFANTAIGYKRHDTDSSTSTPPSTDGSTPSSNTSYDLLTINGAPRAPGMKYRHYAPKGRLILFSDSAVARDRVRSKLDEIIASSTTSNIRIGIISRHWPAFAGLPVKAERSLSEDIAAPAPESAPETPYRSQTTTATLQNNHAVTLYDVTLNPDIEVLAHSLFGILRLFDDLQCDSIFAEMVTGGSGVSGPTNGERQGRKRQNPDLEDAVIDRIEKAAAERVDA
jgi:L-threonylcarbamoyladenylate synthase